MSHTLTLYFTPTHLLDLAQLAACGEVDGVELVRPGDLVDSPLHVVDGLRQQLDLRARMRGQGVSTEESPRCCTGSRQGGPWDGGRDGVVSTAARAAGKEQYLVIAGDGLEKYPTARSGGNPKAGDGAESTSVGWMWLGGRGQGGAHPYTRGWSASAPSPHRALARQKRLRNPQRPSSSSSSSSSSTQLYSTPSI